MNRSFPRLKHVEVDGLLGEYNHAFNIDNSSDFVIIYGPNGIGKTKFLEVIYWTMRFDGHQLARLPFKNVSLTFSDDSQIIVDRNTLIDEQEDDLPLEHWPIRFTVGSSPTSSYTWEFDPRDFRDFDQRDLRDLVRRRLQAAERADEVIGEESLVTDEMLAEYQQKVRRRGRKRNLTHQTKAHSDRVPAGAMEFVREVPSFLIETQRLRIEIESEQEQHWLIPGSQQSKTKSKIIEQAETMKSLLNAAQTEHSRITQKLDRTFPHRVLGVDMRKVTADVGEIRNRYQMQNEFRSRLAQIASVSLGEELPLPDRRLNDWEIALLSQYLEDTEQKFVPFKDLVQKIELLEKIINRRLLNKSLQVTEQEGLVVRHSRTDRVIDLEKLSSGEQHVIILMIDLLFNVAPGALVLIDEPEISLHVAWQVAFIPDVVRIARLAGFQFIVATHSPQIINDRWDRAIALGSGEDFFG